VLPKQPACFEAPEGSSTHLDVHGICQDELGLLNASLLSFHVFAFKVTRTHFRHLSIGLIAHQRPFAVSGFGGCGAAVPCVRVYLCFDDQINHA
jgi:hypothetical protein